MKSIYFASAFAMACSVSTMASAQVPLSAYADSKGYISVQKLTCTQLLGTFQEDADFLGVWYSGWYNGLGKKNVLNVERVKEGIHEVIVHCQTNPKKTVIQAIDFVLKARKPK